MRLEKFVIAVKWRSSQSLSCQQHRQRMWQFTYNSSPITTEVRVEGFVRLCWQVCVGKIFSSIKTRFYLRTTQNFFVVAPCMLTISSSLFVQKMHTFFKTVKSLKSFQIIIVAPTCSGLHKPSSGSSQPVLRQVTMLMSVIYKVSWSYRYCDKFYHKVPSYTKTEYQL